MLLQQPLASNLRLRSKVTLNAPGVMLLGHHACKHCLAYVHQAADCRPALWHQICFKACACSSDASFSRAQLGPVMCTRVCHTRHGGMSSEAQNAHSSTQFCKCQQLNIVPRIAAAAKNVRLHTHSMIVHVCIQPAWFVHIWKFKHLQACRGLRRWPIKISSEPWM